MSRKPSLCGASRRVGTTSRECSSLLVPPAAPGPLRDAFETLLRDRSRRERLGAAARRRASRLFDEQAVFERIDLAYRELGAPLAPFL